MVVGVVVVVVVVVVRRTGDRAGQDRTGLGVVEGAFGARYPAGVFRSAFPLLFFFFPRRPAPGIRAARIQILCPICPAYP